MKNLQTRKMKIQTKVLVGLFITILIICGLLYAVKLINNWFDKHYLQFTVPVEVKLNQPISVKERKPIIQKIVLDYPEIKTPLEHLICDTFGTMDCKIALSVAKAESGMRENAYGVNTNGTIDIGIFQVNQIHWSKEGCSPKELFDAEKNVACAYKIWKASGWNAWSAFNNNNYFANL